MDSEVRIGLYGIFGTYNFGCEAIVRGAVDFIYRHYEHSRIIYFSYSYEFDKNALNDLDIEIFPLNNKRSFMRRAANKMLRTLQSERTIFSIPFREMMEKIDVLFSIGGDIYTIPEYLRKRKKYEYYNQLVDFCDRAISCEKKVIVYGASVGPFGQYKRAVDYYVRNLKKYDIILCREQNSIDYLKGLGLRNVVFFPDPAFTVKLKEKISKSVRYIGINFSPRSFQEVFGSVDDAEIKSAAELLDLICEKFQMPVLLVPHVVPNSKKENDYWFMKKICDNMEHQSMISFADYSGGFLGIKRQLRECAFVVSARMHCAINAICENVPTIFLSYSQKSVGVSKYVYGSDRWVVKLKDMNQELLGKMEEMMRDSESIKEFLKKRNIEIQGQASEFIELNCNDIVCQK